MHFVKCLNNYKEKRRLAFVSYYKEFIQVAVKIYVY